MQQLNYVLQLKSGDLKRFTFFEVLVEKTCGSIFIFVLLAPALLGSTTASHTPHSPN